jgi:PhzF family phenazine biosynthesis protein
MPKVSRDSAPQRQEAGPVVDLRGELDGYTVTFTSLLEDIDGTPFMKGLPDDRCQCPHWGYVIKGKMTARYADRDEVFEAALGWGRDDLDADLPPRVAFAGAWHPIIAASTRDRLADLDYDFVSLAALMAARQWTTIDLVWRESATVFHARNPFPPGGVVEDPATGAAAAAFGGYLRELNLVALPTTLTIYQGADLGRPGVLTVGIGAEPGSGIAVTGTATPLS